MTDINLNSPAWQAKDKLTIVKEAYLAGQATQADLYAAADAYIEAIRAWANSKGRKVRLPTRAALVR